MPNTTTIHKLDPLVIEQVAAGEVIERPVSVVKELLENAVDAGATQIKVEASNGGKTICLQDNGKGLLAADLIAAVEPHSTSKLKVLDDLWSIDSFGFRGEAISAIRSISAIKIMSAHRDENGEIFSPHQLSCRADLIGEPQSCQPSPGAIWANGGTQIEVDDLFFNVPARSQFLASDSAELSRIERLVKRFALSAPGVTISLMIGGIEKMHAHGSLDADDILRDRVLPILGQNSDVVKVDAQATNMRLWGWVLTADSPLKARGRQVLLVNNRIVGAHRVAAAVRAGFEGLLHGQRIPQFVLWLEVLGEDIDVNVHPTKSEVKFKFERAVFGFISTAVREVLAEHRPSRQYRITKDTDIKGEQNHQSLNKSSPGNKPEKGQSKFLTAAEKTALADHWDTENKTDAAIDRALGITTPPGTVEDGGTATSYRPKSTVPSEAALSNSNSAEAESGALLDETGFVDGKLLGTLADTFMLIEVENGLVVVDIHAAHERVLYSKMRQQWDTNKGTGQKLAMPLSLQVEDDASESTEAIGDELQRVGYLLSVAHPREILVESIPANLDTEVAIRILADTLQAVRVNGLDAGKATLSQAAQDVLGDLACRSAVKKGDRLDSTQQRQLLIDMAQAENGDYCNHGRPCWNFLPLSEFDRMCWRGT